MKQWKYFSDSVETEFLGEKVRESYIRFRYDKKNNTVQEYCYSGSLDSGWKPLSNEKRNIVKIKYNL